MKNIPDRITALISELGSIINDIESTPDFAYSLATEDYYVFMDCVKAFAWFKNLQE